ncbi:unnamed protein product [Ambrosiozyma monospora]|uniref:Unnamed protein product n=1 Tax=Ambrosiozyma monospora TaxID=43982 RepID=A0A9W6YZ42_AMBMO|nr:unnamed protein product [Ambrosiozyma monospora]
MFFRDSNHNNSTQDPSRSNKVTDSTKDQGQNKDKDHDEIMDSSSPTMTATSVTNTYPTTTTTKMTTSKPPPGLTDDNSALALWKMYSKARASLPYRARMENLTWRLMYINNNKHLVKPAGPGGESTRIQYSSFMQSTNGKRKKQDVEDHEKQIEQHQQQHQQHEFSRHVNPLSSNGNGTMNNNNDRMQLSHDSNNYSSWPQFPDLSLAAGDGNGDETRLKKENEGETQCHNHNAIAERA